MTEELATICADLGIPLFDLVPVLEAAPGPLFYAIDGHWRSEGHAVASRALAPWLCRFLRHPGAAEAEGTAAGTPRGESDL
jgi:hypothetical protein